MVFGAMLVGGMIGSAMARDRYESLAMEQEQQELLRQAQEKQDQADKAEQAARLQAAQTQAERSHATKEDIFQELEKLGNMKQQGLITDDEFQEMKRKLIASM